MYVVNSGMAIASISGNYRDGYVTAVKAVAVGKYVHPWRPYGPYEQVVGGMYVVISGMAIASISGNYRDSYVTAVKAVATTIRAVKKQTMNGCIIFSGVGTHVRTRKNETQHKYI